MTTYHARSLGRLVREALTDMPVVVVTGLRQSGKSTFLQHETGLARRRYVSLDDFAQQAAARSDPEGFVRCDEPLSIDEAQKCPELLPAIKREVDRARRPGRFMLSGSANFALLRGISESLAGRALYLTLHPFSRRELQARLSTPPFTRRVFEDGRPPKVVAGTTVTPSDVLAGGLPPVCLGQVRHPAMWFKGYEQTYLERDVRELTRVGDLISFRSLLRLAALRTAQVLTISELGRDAKLNATTTARYLSVLEASFVVNRLAPYLSNRASRLIKSPKLYMSDSGLCAHLAGIDESRVPVADLMWGALLETYVAQNLAAILESDWPGARLAYWHVQGRHEVDFVIEVGRDTLAIEVKAAARWDERDLAGLRAFLEKTPRCRAALLAYGGSDLVTLADRLWAVPLATLMS
jgi:predicted AAA+ superfamily ATPase